jgi:hypothetical protein
MLNDWELGYRFLPKVFLELLLQMKLGIITPKVFVHKNILGGIPIPNLAIGFRYLGTSVLPPKKLRFGNAAKLALATAVFKSGGKLTPARYLP